MLRASSLPLGSAGRDSAMRSAATPAMPTAWPSASSAPSMSPSRSTRVCSAQPSGVSQ
jgi:hypothetical protein